MVNSLLSLILAATQVLSWNAAPLYLCLESDGSVCFDFGPDMCGCCHEDAGTQETGSQAACHDHACGHTEHGRPADQTTDSQTSSSPCGCTHVQISDPQTAALGRVTFTAADFDVQHMLATVAGSGEIPIHSAIVHVAGFNHLSAAESPLALRAGIVLRI